MNIIFTLSHILVCNLVHKDKPLNICRQEAVVSEHKFSVIFLQERSHYDNLGHHLGKLGEDGKIGHRVIDLTRPEDFEGKYLFVVFENIT